MVLRVRKVEYVNRECEETARACLPLDWCLPPEMLGLRKGNPQDNVPAPWSAPVARNVRAKKYATLGIIHPKGPHASRIVRSLALKIYIQRGGVETGYPLSL
jgi:hypothetical protein